SELGEGHLSGRNLPTIIVSVSPTGLIGRVLGSFPGFWFVRALAVPPGKCHTETTRYPLFSDRSGDPVRPREKTIVVVPLAANTGEAILTKGEKTEMFGEMKATKILPLSRRETLDEATAKLLELAEHPKILRWIQFPTGLIVFLAHEDSPDSGAVYVYDRKRCVWLWVDFDDQNY